MNICMPVILEHVNDAAALHLYDGLHVTLDQFLLHHLPEQQHF